MQLIPGKVLDLVCVAGTSAQLPDLTILMPCIKASNFLVQEYPNLIPIHHSKSPSAPPDVVDKPEVTLTSEYLHLAFLSGWPLRGIVLPHSSCLRCLLGRERRKDRLEYAGRELQQGACAMLCEASVVNSFLIWLLVWDVWAQALQLAVMWGCES